MSEDAIVIDDMRDGKYKISYAVPSAGDWTMTLSINENAYAVRSPPLPPLFSPSPTGCHSLSLYPSIPGNGHSPFPSLRCCVSTPLSPPRFVSPPSVPPPLAV